MAKYHIRRSYWFKGYVFLFSLLPDRPEGGWSHHECEQEAPGPNKTDQYRQVFQLEHDTQMDGFLAMSNEQLKQEGIVIDDKTDLAKQILNSRQ